MGSELPGRGSHQWRGTADMYEIRHRSSQPEARPPSSSRPVGPPLSAPGAIHPPTQSPALERWAQSNDIWSGRSGAMDSRPYGLRLPPGQYDPVPGLSATRPGQDERHRSGVLQRLEDNAHREPIAPWRQSLHDEDRRLNVSADAPQLTIHTQDLPRLSTSYATVESTNQHAASRLYTSLPSFATLDERNARTGHPDPRKTTPMSEREAESCYNCARLISLVNDVTAAVAELDENVQSYCNRSITRTHDPPKDDSYQAVHWIIDRLRSSKNDLQDAARRNYGYPTHQQQSSGPSAVLHNVTPPNPLKRPAEQWERDDLAALKRPRSGGSSDYHFQLPALTPRDDRRPSVDFNARESRMGFSPPPMGSVLTSSHPRATSPTFTQRVNTRALPSPSSVAYPLSAAPSLAPHAPSISSPSTSYLPAPSIHTASSSSATSAHIADLQHQVTLKSLSLQTLESEYASLLQKLQRERVKSQAIEKKTSVADQEVNELTSKNEDLAEQVKTLETALEESERKREALGAEAAREKEQWGRMLDMSNRLQAKILTEKTKLTEQKAALEERLLKVEGKKEPDEATTAPTFAPPAESTTNSMSSQGKSESHLESEVANLRQQNGHLRSALQHARQNTQALLEQMRVTLDTARSSETGIVSALDAAPLLQEPTRQPVETKLSSSPPPAPSFQAQASRPLSRSPRPLTNPPALTSAREPGTFEVYDNGKRITAKIAEVARAVSPGPQELGFTVVPTTSGPEDLIKALGPVPSATPNLNFALQTPSVPRSSSYGLAPHTIGYRGQTTGFPHASHSSYMPGADITDRASSAASRSSLDTQLGESGDVASADTKGVHSCPAVPPTAQRHQAGRHPSVMDDISQNWLPTISPPPRRNLSHVLQDVHTDR